MNECITHNFDELPVKLGFPAVVHPDDVLEAKSEQSTTLLTF